MNPKCSSCRVLNLQRAFYLPTYESPSFPQWTAPGCRVLATEIDQLDVSSGAPKEPGTEALELLYRVRREAANFGVRKSRLCCEAAAELVLSHFRGGLGGVDDADAIRDRGFDQGAQERVVRAAQDERVWIEARGLGFGVQLVEIDADDLGGDWVIGPALFNKGYEQRTGFLDGPKALCLAGGQISVAVHGGVSGDHQNVAGYGGGVCCRGAGL